MCILILIAAIVTLYAVIKTREDVMSKTDDLLVAVQALKDEEALVLQYITTQALKLADISAQLQALIDAGGSSDPKIQEAIDSINTVVTDLQTKITPPEAPVV